MNEARVAALHAQRLLTPSPGLGIPQVIDQLGVVQLDAINVVARSPYLIMWSRLGAYDATRLDATLFPDRIVFEYWGHAASILPLAEYAYYRSRMLSAEFMWKNLRAWMDTRPPVLQTVLDAIRERGPMTSAEFERPAGARRTDPWDWYGPKDTRRALDALWTTGALMVHSRRAGQKVYDLRERVFAEAKLSLPDDRALPSADEQLRHFTERTVRAIGIATPAWIRDYFRLPAPASKRPWSPHAMLERLADDGVIARATVEGFDAPTYISHDALAAVESGARAERTTLLSPFDSLIWDRARARAMFDFTVTFEAYVVPEKRRFGYFSLAILHEGRLIGRLDPKVERGRDGARLIARALHLEHGEHASESTARGVAEALLDLAKFVGADEVRIGRTGHRELASAVRGELSALA